MKWDNIKGNWLVSRKTYSLTMDEISLWEGSTVGMNECNQNGRWIMKLQRVKATGVDYKVNLFAFMVPF